MRLSRLFSKTRKTKPKKEDSLSAQLLIQAGFISKVGSGLYDYLPLGFRVLKKIEYIIREELNKVGAQEILSSLIQPAHLWQKSGRIKDFGPELATFKNRKDQRMVIAPTHEETISLMGQKYIESYQDLPQLVNQIQLKFRDEPRARGGLLRAREFIMQDAYSFHKDKKSLNEVYSQVKKAYENIFNRCGLETLVVDSYVGAMGGEGGEEFMLENEDGEDTLITCSKCGYKANLEVAEFEIEKSKEKEKELEEVATPKEKTIDELCKKLSVKPEKTAKMVFYENSSKENEKGSQLIAVLVRGDLDTNELKLESELKVSELEPADDSLIRKVGAQPGFANPIDIKANIIVDPTIENSKNLVIGANKEGYHLKNFNLDRDLKKKDYTVADIAQARKGLTCSRCGSFLDEKRGIELGHIFKLGKKYSKSLDVTYTNESGKEEYCQMGCYGIGLGRLMGAVVENFNDENGIIWPREIAPHQYYLIVLGENNEVEKEAEKVYKKLIKAGKDVLYDDRQESAGVKFNDADLIGCPNRLVVSEKTIENDKIELSLRGKDDKELIDLKNIIAG